MNSSIIKIKIETEQDVALARQRARQIAQTIGFGRQDQTRIATAVSEIVRNAFNYASDGEVEFYLDDSPKEDMLTASVRDSGEGIKDLKSILEEKFTSKKGMGLGISGARRLMDHFEIESTPGEGTTVILGKKLPSGKGSFKKDDLNKITKELTKYKPQDSQEEIKEQNQELIYMLDKLRNKQDKLIALNKELEDTNAGLIALQGELEQKREKLKNLHDAVDELQQQDTEDELVETAVEVAEKMLDFELCAIDLLEGDYLVPRANSGGLDPEETTTFKIGEGIAGKTVQRGETIWGDNVRKHPEAKPTNDDFRAFISIPIGELGIFQVISEEAGFFHEEDVELAEILAGHLREELNRVRLEKELRRQAIRDPLTKLYNRRYFNETLQKEVRQAERYDKPLAFLMIDVNRFKEINDRYSHQTGDEVLKEVANLLEENLRNADTVVRYGGDEFLVMMPETNGEATNAVDRLKEGLNRWNRESHLLDFPLTLAMGVSHWSPDQERDIEETFNEADEKMYENKRENR